jgi:ribonuclease P protein component
VNRSRGRLTRSEDFTRVYRAGRSVSNRYLVLYFFERPPVADDGKEGTEGARVGFSVSKRLGGAVERNSVKRMLREAYRTCSETLSGDTDLVFVARTPLMELLEAGGLSAVKEKMAEVLSKASLSQSPEEGRVTS